MKDLPLSNDEKIGIILVLSQHVAGSVDLERDLAEVGAVSIPAEGVE